MKFQKDAYIYLARSNQNSRIQCFEYLNQNVSPPLKKEPKSSQKGEQKIAQKIHKLLVWLLLLSLLIGLPSSQGAQAQADIRLGTMIIAVSNASPPFSAKASNGYLVGFDLDLIKKIVRTAGLRVTYEDAPFRQLIPGVSTHLYDAAISCIFVNDQRRTLVNFSSTYFTTGTLLVVHKGDETIHSLADIGPDRVVSVSQGSTAEKFIRENSDAQVLLASSLGETLENVNSGNAHAALTDEISVAGYMKNRPDAKLKTVGSLITNDQCAIAVNKDNIQLLIELNAALTRLQNNGKYRTMYQRWFGSRPQDGPQSHTTTLPLEDDTDDEPNNILIDAVSGLYDVTIQTEPPTYQTIELSPDGRWQETMLTDVASLIQSGIAVEEAAIPQRQVGQWQIATKNPLATEIEIQASVPLAELSAPGVESADITGDQAVTRTVSTPIRKEYSVNIATDGTLHGSYKLYAHQTAISNTSDNLIDETKIATEIIIELVEFSGQRVIR